MGLMDAKDIRSRIEALSKEDAARKVFGASSHEYVLQPPLTEVELGATESQFGVRFPDDYRTFLAEISSGGAGPLYGIFPLTRVNGAWRWDGDGADLVSSLREPFPHMSAWTPSIREREDEEDEDAYWRERDAWDEALYFNPHQTHGAICICHEGCAIRDGCRSNAAA
jgi:hypothetical protein